MVIGRNEGQRLVDCLSSLRVHAARTIYVDSGSEDRSTEVARDMGVHVVDLDMRQPFTAARARNIGFSAARERWPETDFVQFVDGDCVVDPEWIGKAFNFMRTRPDVAIVFGRRRERYVGRSIYNWLCDREWDGDPGIARECGGDVFARAKALDTVGAYRSSLIAGEEPELCIRLRANGWAIWRVGDEMTLHDANLTTLRQWWRRNRRAGHAFAEVSNMHWRSPQGIWKRSLLRAVGWGGALPLVAIAGAVAHPAALTLLALYPVQVARIAARSGFSRDGWRSGYYSMLGKFAEFQGAANWMANRLTGRQQKIIEYK